jgi:alpha-glucosidase
MMRIVAQIVAQCMALLLMLCAVPAAAETVATVASPSKLLTLSLALDQDGRPSYAVSRGGKIVIAPSRLGFILADAPKLDRNFQLARQSSRSVDESWDQPWGEWKSIRNHFNELRVRLTEKNTPGRSLDIVFRVYDDGLGFRYEFPDQPNLQQVNIVEELTQFAVAEAAEALWIPAIEWNREEYLYNRTPIEAVGLAQTPMTIKTASGLHVAFHEAALVDYAAMNLQKVEGGLLKAVLTQSASGPKVRRAAPFPTPWRTLQISDDAAGLYMSNLILNLNEPNKLGDVSWVKPHKYVGIWWGMHLETQSWATGPKHGATTKNALALIDFAAKNGFPGMLVEGWNLGWDGDWFGNGEEFSFTQATPDFDIAKIAAYGKTKGVHIIGHHETSGNVAHYEDQMAAGFAFYQGLGINAVKTGYVADAGGMKVRLPDGRISYEWHEGQASARHHLKVLTEAAKYKIAIDTHEPIKDTGLRRTYPNWVSREGARGMEYNCWAQPKNPPAHEVNLVFTRMLAGPMDFTPGILSLKGRGGTDILSTIAKQLALYVVIYSPIQMAADLPENYAKYPAAFQFIKDVPTDWADTRVLAGEIGDYVAIARKNRAGNDWYIGAVGDEEARTMTVKLDFLESAKTYSAEIYRDGPGADYRTEARHAIVIERKKVRAGDNLVLALAPGGGQAIRLIPSK